MSGAVPARTAVSCTRQASPAIFSILLILLALLAFVVPQQLHFAVDEGYLLAAATRASQGDIIYKDFFFLYPPLLVALLLPIVQLTSGLWTVTAERLLLALLVLFSGVLARTIVFMAFSSGTLSDGTRSECAFRRFFSDLAALAVVLFLFLKFPILTPSFLANFFVLCFLFLEMNRALLVRSDNACSRIPSWVFSIGSAAAVAFVVLAKHNIGLYLSGGLFMYAASASFRTRKTIIPWSGFAGVLLGFLALLAYGEAFGGQAMYEQLFVFPNQYAKLGVDLANPVFLLNHAIILVVGLLIVAFLILLVIRNGAAFRNASSNRTVFRTAANAAARDCFVLLLLSLAGAMLLQGFLYGDIIHLLDGCFLLPLAGVAGTAFFHRGPAPSPVRKLFANLAATVLILLTLLALLVTARFFVSDTLSDGQLSISHGLLLSGPSAETVQVAEIIHDRAGEGRPLFVYPNDAILLVLTDGRNPTPYNQFFHGYHETAEEQQAVIAGLIRARPTIVVRGALDSSHYPLLEEYLREQRVVQEAGPYTIRATQ